MKIDYSDHYDKDYWTAQKTYHDHEGKVRRYNGPALDWGAWDEIYPVLNQLLSGKTILDIGCGGGGLAARFLKDGWDAWGVDISKHAVENCNNAMRGRLAVADITQAPEALTFPADDGGCWVNKESYDVVMATDLMEHIYEEDLDHTFDWMLSKTKRFMFLLIAAADPVRGEEPNKWEFCHKKGEPVPPAWEATAVSGHVNVRSWRYWVKFFNQKGVKIRWDLMYRFQAARDRTEWWKSMMAWGHDCTYFLEV